MQAEPMDCHRPAFPRRPAPFAGWSRRTVLGAALAGAAALVTPAGAQPLLAGTPAWSVPPGELVRAVAAADVDLSGTLDLVLGNESGVLQLFLNRSGQIESAPSWTHVAPAAITSVALGDVNGDGRADVAAATRGGPVEMYWSSTASTIFPDRRSAGVDSLDAACIALADVDADGDLDLVTCSATGGTAAYANSAGTFRSPPLWTVAEPATHLVVADVDRDGRLDVVTSDPASGLRLYRGEGAAFATAPVWIEPDSGSTDLALGDLDADGDPDLVAGGLAPRATRIFENLGTAFGALPAFTLTTEDSTATLALGDADQDGDLDLACGNTSRSRVYRNGGGLALWSPAWTEPAGAQGTAALVRWLDVDGGMFRDLLVAHDSTSVYRNLTTPFAVDAVSGPITGRPLAVTDLNGDSRPDLVAADAGNPAAVYLNTGERFDANADWTSAPGIAVAACAAGDVNGDGGIDLVLGGTTIAVYLHTGPGLSPTPAWTNALGGVTAVALRDVDRDGKLDLLVGRTSMPSLLYFQNRNGTFRQLADWEGGTTAVTSIALGDIDRDGDADLAAGTPTDGAMVFGFDGSFGAAPRWTFLPGTATSRVFLEDLDGDGDPDMVLANDGLSATFTNFDGFFASAPTQTTPLPRPHIDGAIEDLDADGDLDLVLLAAPGAPSEFYASGRGQYEAGIPLPGVNGQRVQAADVDSDGDFDLVTGGDGAPIAIVPGTAAPVFRTGPVRGAGGLPNQDPWLRAVQMTNAGRNLQHVTVDAFDAENDSLWIVAETQLRGAAAWSMLDAGQRHGLLGPFAASAAGSPLAFDWDLSRLLTTAEPYHIRLRSVPVRHRTGESQVVPTYLFNAGTLTVQRPIIAAEPQFVRFDRVTVGDTAQALLTIRNSGSETLIVEQFEFQGTRAIRTNPPAPLPVAPGSHAEVFLYFEPVVPEVSRPGEAKTCIVHSNDPANPRPSIDLTVEAVALTGRAQALLPDSLAALGQPVVVQVTPANAVHIERATLYAAPAAGDFQPFTMKKRPLDFIATIPGAFVREAGLRFYVQFENSRVTTTDPPGAPDSAYAVPVARPSRLQVTPQPTSRLDFLVGRDINVEIALEPGAEFADGTLYYRQGGEIAFTTEPVLIDFLRGVTRAIIPAAAVGPRGLEFYAKVYTSRDSLFYPKLGPRAPDSIRTLAPSLLEPAPHAGGRYRMVSLPLDFSADAARTLDVMLGDQPEFGPYDVTRWRAFRYLDGGNVERQAGDPRFDVVPGRAFWLVSRTEHRVDTAPIAGLSVSTGVPFPLVLEPGWNQIANPFAFPVRWSRIAHSAAIEAPLGFDPARGASGEYVPEPAAVLQPFDGYFVFNSGAAAETLFVRPVDAAADTLPPAAPKRPSAEWSVEVAVQSAKARDGGNRAVVDTGALDGLDPLDRRDPPMPPAPWVRAGFQVEGAGQDLHSRAANAAPVLLRTDARPPSAAGHAWTLDIGSSSAAEPLDVHARVDGTLPPGFALWILDPETGSVTPVDGSAAAAGWVRATRILSHGPARAYTLRLLAGTPEWLNAARAAAVAPPRQVTLAPNAPNPFNATTRIRFGLPAAAHAGLEIFDARGRRVAVLADGPLDPGWHDRLWDGRDSGGRAVATGVYFCRLRAGNVSLSRRLVLVE